MPPLIEVRGLRKSFGHNEVLKGIDLSVDPKDVVCIIGPSGCGKSTLLRCLTRLVEPTAGTIILDGQEVTAKGADIRLLRERFVTVFQAFNLFPHLTALENITLPLRRVLGLGKEEAEARANAMLAQVGLESKVNEYPGRL